MNWMVQKFKAAAAPVSGRPALQVQRIYRSQKAYKSCSVFMMWENKMSPRPPNKTSCLHVHGSREMNQKNPPFSANPHECLCLYSTLRPVSPLVCLHVFKFQICHLGKMRTLHGDKSQHLKKDYFIDFMWELVTILCTNTACCRTPHSPHILHLI